MLLQSFTIKTTGLGICQSYSCIKFYNDSVVNSMGVFVCEFACLQIAHNW